MLFPEELEYNIISYIHYSNYINVCKNWNTRIQEIQKKYSNVIATWYKLKITSLHWKNTKNVRCLLAKYSLDYSQHIPERAVLTLGLPLFYITTLPELKVRTKRDIRNWILDIRLNPADWIYLLSL